MYGTLMGMTGLVSSKGRGPTPPPAGPAGKAKGCAAAAKAAKASKASKAPRVNHAPAPAPASEAARPKAKVLKASAAGGDAAKASRRSAAPSPAAAAAADLGAAEPPIREVEAPAVCKNHLHGVYELPRLLPAAACDAVVAEVLDKVKRGAVTDRGAGLPTKDVYVRDVANAAVLYRASGRRVPARVVFPRARARAPAGGGAAAATPADPPADLRFPQARRRVPPHRDVHGQARDLRAEEGLPHRVRVGRQEEAARPRRRDETAARCLGRARASHRHARRARAIARPRARVAPLATRRSARYAGLGKHKDGNRDNQGPTLLITLDAPTDYVGGGTRFHPGDGWEGEPEAAPPPMDVRPDKGCGVTFGPKIQHEGLRITAGRRHLLCIFPDLVPEAAPEPEKRRVRDAQRHAALVVFGRLKKKA